MACAKLGILGVKEHSELNMGEVIAGKQEELNRHLVLRGICSILQNSGDEE